MGLACGIAGGEGASYGNTRSIWNSGVRLTKKIASKGFSKAWSYYAKTAHRADRKFVMTALAKSLGYSAAGAGAITLKNWAGGFIR